MAVLQTSWCVPADIAGHIYRTHRKHSHFFVRFTSMNCFAIWLGTLCGQGTGPTKNLVFFSFNFFFCGRKVSITGTVVVLVWFPGCSAALKKTVLSTRSIRALFICRESRSTIALYINKDLCNMKLTVIVTPIQV